MFAFATSKMTTNEELHLKDDNFDAELNKLDLNEGFVLDIPKEIVFPNELNKFLRDTVQYLTHENGMLKKNLSETECELDESKSKVSVLMSKLERRESAEEFMSVTNVARGKIVELSRKLRDKTSEVEVLRSRCCRLEKEALAAKSAGVEKSEPVKPDVAEGELELEVKSLRDKTSALSSKLFEERNASHKLRNDLKLAHRILQEEIGSAFESLQQIAGNGGWVGRAKTISELQHKNRDLQEQLRTYQDKDNKEGFYKKKSLLEKRIEKLQEENDGLKSENVELRKRVESGKARLKSVDTECMLWKSKCSLLGEQIEKEKSRTSTITQEYGQNLNNLNEQLKKKESAVEKLQKDVRDLRQELKEERFKVANVEKTLADKETELANWKSTTQHGDAKSDDKTISRLEAERVRMVELVEVLNRRIGDERDARANAEKLHRLERQRAAKLEAKMARMRLEEPAAERGSYCNLGRTNNNELDCRLKLQLAEEHVKALQTRLETEKRERELDLQEFARIVKGG